MSLKFVPPKQDKKIPRYASYGSGQMKLHSEVGHAKSSLSNRCQTWGSGRVWNEGFILELVDGEWFVLYHVPEGTLDNLLPWKKKVWVNYGRYGTSVLHEQPSWKAEDYTVEYRTYPMSRDEYADWRVAVKLEQLAEQGVFDTEVGTVYTNTK